MNSASSGGNSNNARPRRETAPSPLRAARLAKGLSQAELAAAAGLSAGWVSLLERAPGFITARVAQRLAEALGVPVEAIRP